MIWHPIETAPMTGFFLVAERGAIRTMFRFKGVWSPADIPVLINEFGDRMVSSEVNAAYGTSLDISQPIHDPTHWMRLPEPPND